MGGGAFPECVRRLGGPHHLSHRDVVTLTVQTRACVSDVMRKPSFEHFFLQSYVKKNMKLKLQAV